jgi:hypothetical protein
MAKSETVLDPMLTLRLATAMYRLAQHRIQGIGSTAWPMADGTIFDGAVQQDDLLGWATELTYSYTALGDYYSGIFRRGFRRKKKAEAFLERFPRQTPVPVRFKSENPEISRLLLSDMHLLLAGL